ncbi:MAG: hypothetical protein AABM29_04420 [Actinomycetota bacterium]
MLGLIAATALLLGGSWVVGHAFLRRLGSAIDPGAAPAIGFSVILVLATAAVQLPGDDLTAALCVALLLAAALVASGGRPPAPGASELWLAATLMLVLCIPFLASGRWGVLGAGRNDDLGLHLAFVDALASGVDVSTLSSFFESYPLGPHSLGAMLAPVPGLSDLSAMLGVTAAAPILAALVVSACLRSDLGPGRASICGGLAGLSYIPAAYFGTGQFKELIAASLAIGFAFALRSLVRAGRVSARDGLPLGFLVAGNVSTMGYPGAAWPLSVVGLWLGLELIHRRGRPSTAHLRVVSAIALVALLTCLAVLIPQAGRVASFDPASTAAAGGDPDTFFGFLSQELPLREALGLWPSQDISSDPGTPGLVDLANVLALLALLAGTIWWFRRRDPILPLAALGALVIALVAEAREGPYITAKTMVVLAPMLPVVIFVPLLAWTREGVGRTARAVAVATVTGLAALAAWSSILVLRGSPVGPLGRGAELRGLAAEVGDRPLLFIAGDHYASWELSGTRLSMAITYGMRPQVPYRFRAGYTVSARNPPDFDSFTPRSLNRFAYAITTASALSGPPPPNWSAAQTTPSFVLWRRDGAAESADVAALDGPGSSRACSPGDVVVGRRWRLGTFRLYRSGFGFVAVNAGTTIAQSLDLAPGRWELSLQYSSRRPLTLTAGGRPFSLPPDSSPKGNYWRVGTIRSQGGRLPVLVSVEKGNALALPTFAEIGALAAVRRGGRC